MQQLNEFESKQYHSVVDLEQEFVGGNMSKLPQQINVYGVLYRFSSTTNYGWDEIIAGKKKAMSAYTVHPNADNMKKFKSLKSDSPEKTNAHQDTLVMLWGINRQLKAIPAMVKFIPSSRRIQTSVRGVTEGTEIKYDEQIVIHNFNNNQPIPCKIDTGADMCSLHAEDIQVSNDSVSFTFEGRQYRMSTVGSQTVRQADSEEEVRPTVKFNVQLAGETITDVECNLNDRSGMSSPMLIGKNLLAKGDFSINTYDPEAVVETIDSQEWEHISKLMEEFELPNIDDQQLCMDDVVKYVMENDVTFKHMFDRLITEKN